MALVASLRRLRLTAAELADLLTMPLSTVSAVLLRIGLGKRLRLEPPNRYERGRASEFVHIDIRKLAKIGRPGHDVHGDRVRGIGWGTYTSASPDATRLAYVEVLANEIRNKVETKKQEFDVGRAKHRAEMAKDDALKAINFAYLA